MPMIRLAQMPIPKVPCLNAIELTDPNINTSQAKFGSNNKLQTR